MKTLLVFICCLTFPFSGTFAQTPLRIKSDIPPSYLVKKVLLEGNSSIQVSNVQYIGHEKSLGGFTNDSKYYLIKKGIILSTGFSEDAMGPNQFDGMGTALARDGIKELDDLAKGKTYDGTSLSFEFVAIYDTIQFNFMFASEEYPEYVNKGVNDVFAFFIEDLQSGQRQNLAVLKGDGASVNVDNVNSMKNSESYIKNGKWDANNIAQWSSDPGLGELALTYEFDGFTSLLSAGSAVVPGKKYRITFCIADVGDRVYDSAVFLEAGSFVSFSSKPNETFKLLQREFENEFSESSVKIEMKEEALLMRVLINFEFDAYSTEEDSSLAILNKISRLLKLHGDLNLDIMGHTDNFGTEEYNLNLSQRRADFAADYLESSGVLKERIQTTGYGDEKPVSDNITARGRLKNRRIEFLFHRP